MNLKSIQASLIMATILISGCDNLGRTSRVANVKKNPDRSMGRRIFLMLVLEVIGMVFHFMTVMIRRKCFPLKFQKKSVTQKMEKIWSNRDTGSGPREVMLR